MGLKKLALLACFGSVFAHAETITVFAASSLSDVLGQMTRQFEQRTGHKVQLQFAGSQVLKTQILQGAKADIFISAASSQTEPLKQQHMVQAENIFAKNRIAVLIPKNSRITSLGDLAKPKTKIVMADASVPAGEYSLAVLNNLNRKYGKDYRNKVFANVVSKENNVRAAVLKVSLGEADACFAYLTDLTPSLKDKLKALYIPNTDNVIASYPMVLLKNASPAAKSFFEYAASAQSKTILKQWGFIP